MKRIALALLALVMMAAVSCTKEDAAISSTGAVPKAYNLPVQSINNSAARNRLANISWIDRVKDQCEMLSSAKFGNTLKVSIKSSNEKVVCSFNLSTTQPSKDVYTFSTDDINKLMEWIEEMKDKGYNYFEIYIDQTTGIYFGKCDTEK